MATGYKRRSGAGASVATETARALAAEALLAPLASPVFTGSPMLGGSKVLALPTSNLVNAFTPEYGFLSADTAAQTNQMYVVAFKIPIGCTITGLAISNGTVVSGHVIVGVWNAAASILKASSASTVVAGTSQEQLVPFSGSWSAPQDVYLATIIFDNSTTRFNSANARCASKSLSQGGFALPASFVAPSNTSRLTVCPVVGTY